MRLRRTSDGDRLIDPTLSSTLAHRSDAERIRLRLGTAFIEHRDDIWPNGEPTRTDAWIRVHTDLILLKLERAYDIGRCGRPLNLNQVPHRLHER